LCKHEVNENLGNHIKRVHGGNEFNKAVLKAKDDDLSDPEIGALFNIDLPPYNRAIV
jgi:hypothetical protein